MSNGIGRIERVPLREVWRHEAYDFTRWLETNVDILNEVLDVSLDNVERERAAGSFSVDLVADDENGNAVVIENQLERSDHDHLGKVITYLAAFQAKTAIWIVSEPRTEHVGAIVWLNESTAADFYLVKVEAVRIGESPAAPLLTLIAGPTPEAKQVGVQKHERAERHDLRQAFWEALLQRALPQTKLHSGVSAGADGWIAAGSGRSGIHFIYGIRRHDGAVRLYLEGSDAEQNHRNFDTLYADREAVELRFGGPLEWDRVENRKRCSIGVSTDGGYKDDPSTWPETQDRMIDAMVRLETALRPALAQLR